MTLSSSPDSDGLQQLSQGPSSSAEQAQDPPRKLAVLGLPWDTRYNLVSAGNVAMLCRAILQQSAVALAARFLLLAPAAWLRVW